MASPISHVQSVAGALDAGTSDTILIPTVQVGDLLLLFCVNKGAAVAPAVVDDDATGNLWALAIHSTRGSIWWKRATAATSGKTITASGFTTGCAIGLSVYRNVDGVGLPIENLTAVAQASGVETLTGFTPSRNYSLICIAVFSQAFNTAYSTWATASSPGVLDERLDVVNGTNICSMGHASKLQNQAAPTGDFSWAQVNTSHVTIIFNLLSAHQGDGGVMWRRRRRG